MNEEIWNQTLKGIKSQVEPQQFLKWFASLSFLNLHEDKMEISAPNMFVRDWVHENYLTLLQEEISRQIKRPIRIAIHVPENGSFQKTAKENPPPTLEKKDFLGIPTRDRHGLRGRYTFEEFVVGSSNQFAHAACVAVCDVPAGKYNPLFIFGGVGLGKTHLLHAIGNKILAEHTKKRVVYLSSETFVNELINAIRFEKMPQFREKFRALCDVLLVDDIQFLSGKERTQEEFFHTFNTLYEAGKQIVLSSDTFPKDIKGLEERLRSRFEWGLIADIQAPEMETRVAIIKQKAEANGLYLPDEVAHYLATLMKSNVRELEGSLIRLGAYASLANQKITLELAKEVLKNLQLDKNRFLSIDKVQMVVSSHFNLKPADLKSARKSKNLTYPRQIAMYLCRKVLKCSFPDIGSKFGGKDHSTVIHAVRKIEGLLGKDDQLRSDVQCLEKSLQQ